MFEEVDEAGLIATIEDATRSEAAAGSLRSAAIAELTARRIGDDMDDPRASWACDIWDSAAAEIAAAMNISHRKASGQMRIAETLRDHLPAVAALYRAGRLSARVISTITWRTRLITDDDVWASLDAEVAQRAQRWGPLSEDKLVTAVDALVYTYDPSAVIEAEARAKTCDFTVGYYDDEAGVASVWGTLPAADAAVVEKNVAAVAATVCDNDRRPIGKRRAAALRALTDGNEHLPCECGSPDCPVRGQYPAPKSAVIVHVLADQAAVDAAQTPATGTADTVPELIVDSAGETAAPDSDTPRRTAACRREVGTAILSGSEVLPTAMLAELLRSGAKLQPLCTPDDRPERGYRPSAKLAHFVRCRDLTCRFPGCTAPAEHCDIDHVIPYPIGPTHPSNLACLCRKHHHLKTFWTGDWALILFPDGTAIWTSPTGRTYTTYPGCRSLFPEWDPTTAELPPPPDRPPPADTRALMMPIRKRTRAVERASRIKAERAQNNSDPPPC
jgi:hypothetical protein